MPSKTDESGASQENQLLAVERKFKRELDAWQRWFPRLKRAFNEVVKVDARLRRLQRKLHRLAQERLTDSESQ